MNSGILCPSYRCKPGSHLLGIRKPDGTTAIFPVPLQLGEEFFEQARLLERPAEQYFRFTNKCIEKGCAQWNGTGCDVANNVLQFLDTIPATAGLPQCAIRKQCRWYFQKGEDACKICPYVLTEFTREEIFQAIGQQNSEV